MMQRRRSVASLVAIVIALSVGAAAAQETQPTDLVVQVRNEAGDPVAGQEIFVVVSNGQEVTDELTGTTSPAGEVRFEDIAAGPGYTARPVAVSEGFPYQGDRTTLTPGVETILPLTIASLSETPANLHIDVLHIILNIVEPGLYQALQVMSVLNVDERAAYSAVQYQGQPVGMVIPLPTGAVLGAPLPPEISGLDPNRLAQDGNRLLDLRPVPPGTHQVAVQYEIATGADGADVTLTVPQPTAQVSILLGPGIGTVTIDSEQLSELDPVSIEGQGEYANYTSDVLAAGDTLSFRIGPQRPPITVASWSLLALAVALLASAAASIFFSRPSALDPQQRQRIVADIARLDEQHAAGTIEDAAYHARRGAAIDRLLQLGGASGASGGGRGD